MEVFFFLPKSVPNNLGTLGIDPSSSASVPNNSVLMAADRSNGFVVTCAYHNDLLYRRDLVLVNGGFTAAFNGGLTVNNPLGQATDYIIERMPFIECGPGAEFRYTNQAVDNEIKVWSNQGLVYWSGDIGIIESIDISSSVGEKIYSIPSSEFNLYKFDMNNLAKGIYIARYKEQGQKAKTIKLFN